MDSLKISNWMSVGLVPALSMAVAVGAQTAAPQGALRAPAPQAAQQPGTGLQLHNMGEFPKADPFPQPNPKYFTARCAYWWIQ